jgi:hypothetical protein
MTPHVGPDTPCRFRPTVLGIRQLVAYYREEFDAEPPRADAGGAYTVPFKTMLKAFGPDLTLVQGGSLVRGEYAPVAPRDPAPARTAAAPSALRAKPNGSIHPP